MVNQIAQWRGSAFTTLVDPPWWEKTEITVSWSASTCALCGADWVWTNDNCYMCHASSLIYVSGKFSTLVGEHVSGYTTWNISRIDKVDQSL